MLVYFSIVLMTVLYKFAVPIDTSMDVLEKGDADKHANYKPLQPHPHQKRRNMSN